MKLTHDRENAVSWNYSEVETALCLWEAVLDFRTIGYAKQQKGEDPGETYRKLEELFDGAGSFTMRAIVASMVSECNQAFEAVNALTGGYTDSFDFDFCPQFVADALDNGLFDQAFEWQHMRDETIRERTDWQYPLAA